MKSIAALLLAAGFVTFAHASADPTAVVKGATEQLQAQIRANGSLYRQDPATFHRTASAAIAPAFDLAYTSQLVLGKHWRTSSPEQRTRFQAAFAKSLVNTYGDALLERESARIQWQLSSMDGLQGTAAVRAQVTADGAPLSILFSLRLDDAGRWRVYDVTIEGISLVGNFRSQFASEVRARGVDALIARLEP